MNIACICDFKNVSYCYLSLLLPVPVSTLQALHTWTFCPGLWKSQDLQVHVTAECLCWIG